MMNRNTPILKLTISVAIAVIVFQSSVFGQRCQYEHDYHWVAGTGDWSVPENWEHNAWDPASERCVRTPGVPGADDTAFIENGGTAIITGSVQVQQLSLALVYGPGTVIQIGGDLTISKNLSGGYLSLSGGGRYELRQGSLNANGISYGYSDGGNFIQTGGNVDLNGYRTEGYLFLTGQGRYELREGNFNANTACVGSGTPGAFVQTGGKVNIRTHLSIKEEGTYELRQGSVIANEVFIGNYGGPGTFVQTGGDLTIGNYPFHLCLGEGTYELLGGTIDTPSILVGYSGFGWKYSRPASFVVNGGVINGTSESEYGSIRVYGSRGSLTGPGTFNIPVVYKSEEIYGTSGNRSVDVTFNRNCLTEGGAYNVRQLGPDDFADGNVPNLLQSSVFEVNFDGSFCGEFEIAIPYDRTELEALDMDETNIFILHETSEGKYERLDDTIARYRQGVAKAKTQTFGKFAVACLPRVILVHGWRPALESDRVATWKTLKGKFKEIGIPYHEFSYLPATGDPRAYAKSLKEEVEALIKNNHERTRCFGKFDIVCHSMGAMVSRWYMKEMGGNIFIRQWIGVAPVNNGAAIADWWLAHLRYPGEKAIEQMRIKSPSLSRLNYNIPQFDIDIWGQPQQLSPYVIYRNIIGIQDSNTHYPPAKTIVAKKDYEKRELYTYWTYRGDGVVAMEQSLLQGNNVGNQVFIGRTHSRITSDPDVINEIIDYLMNSSRDLINDYPLDEDMCDGYRCDDHWVSATDNRGYIFQREIKEIKFPIDSSVQRARIVAEWDGSDMDMILISPGGIILEPNADVVEYGKTDTMVCYEINMPEAGEWTAVIEAIDVPPEGEPFEFMTFYSSPLILEVVTTENRTYYHEGDLVNIGAKCSDGNTLITGSDLTATIVSPSSITENFALFDDGSHGDVNPNDGYYSNDYLLLQEGAYQITILARGTFNGTLFERTVPMTFWVISRADITYDTKVDFYDFSIFAQQWMKNKCEESNWCDGADIDYSGQVDFIDLGILVDHWLEDTAP